MIESIHIKNFRGIQDGKIDRFSKINLLVGPNNSGKTTILESLYLANTASHKSGVIFENGRKEGWLTDNDLLGEEPVSRVLRKHGKAFTHLQSAKGGGHHIGRSFPFSVDIVGSVPSFSLFSVTLDSIYRVDRSRGHVQSEKPFVSFAKVMLEGISISENEREGWRFIYCWESLLSYFQAGESVFIIKGLNSAAANTLFFDARNIFYHLPFDFFRRMINTIPGWTQKIAGGFKRIFGLKSNFNVTFLQLQHDISQTQGFIAPEDKVALTIDDYGDGARSAFKLLTPVIALVELATEAEPGVLIWEEPELFQNPRTLGKLLEEIALLIKNKPVQLFIATHSLDVIAQFTALAESGQIEHDDLMTFRLNLQEGQLTSSWFNVDNLKAWMEEGLDPRVWGEFKSPLQFRFQEESE